jgi:hypothetical protein
VRLLAPTNFCDLDYTWEGSGRKGKRPVSVFPVQPWIQLSKGEHSRKHAAPVFWLPLV